jgi:protein TonB
MDFFYKFRQWLSGPPAIIIAIIVITTPITRVVERMVPKDLFEMPITLSDPAPPPPPPPPKQVQVQPQEVQPVVAPQVQDVITRESVVIETRPAPPPEPVKVVEAPKVIAPPPQVAVGTGPSIGQIQAGYETKIKAYLESIKRYPTSREARSQRPTGRVGLWIEVSRDGTLKDVGIAKSSDFILLDNAALATVRQGKFPPFPADTYPGESFRRFTFTLEYNLEQPS